MLRTVWIILLLTTQISWAQGTTGESAYRQPGVSYKEYVARARLLRPLGTEIVDKTAEESAVRYADAQLPMATRWKSEPLMLERFKMFRDLRFMDDRDHQNFPRRSSWLYPDDGCYARAALAVRNLKQMHAPMPSKVFVFGDLTVKTKNSPKGQVSWWYHVAPLIEIAGQKYVLDPAIEPLHPLKLEDWLATMSAKPENLEVAVCGSGAYQPMSACATVSDGRELEAEETQVYFLSQEWRRLEALRRNPEQELGDNPPWN